MAKKNDAFYYDSFAKAAELACKAAEKLDDVMRHFDPAKIEDAVAEMHEYVEIAERGDGLAEFIPAAVRIRKYYGSHICSLPNISFSFFFNIPTARPR